MPGSLAAGGSQGAAAEGTRPVAVDTAAEGSPAEQGNLAEQGSLAAEGSLVGAGRQGQAVWGNRRRAGGAVSLGQTDSLELASRTDSLEVARRGALGIERKTK